MTEVIRKNTHNGWTNRPTWNVNLWMFNTEGLYELWKAQSKLFFDNWHVKRDSAGWTKERAEAFSLRVWSSGKTPDGDLLSEVNWDEVSDSWNESWSEH
jgi:hypothetical protein